MKVLVAGPVLPWYVAESLTVAVPVAVEELLVTSIILLYEYPAFTAAGRRLSWSWSGKDRELFHVFMTSWSFKRVWYYELGLPFTRRPRLNSALLTMHCNGRQAANTINYKRQQSRCTETGGRPTSRQSLCALITRPVIIGGSKGANPAMAAIMVLERGLLPPSAACRRNCH